MIAMHANSFIERLCTKQEICSQCDESLEVVKDCIIMNECGHMMHEHCFRKLQEEKQYTCKTCKNKITILFILNQIQVVQIMHNQNNSILPKRKPEIEKKIVSHFFNKLMKIDELSNNICKKDSEIIKLRERIKHLEKLLYGNNNGSGLNNNKIGLHQDRKSNQNDDNMIFHQKNQQELFSFTNNNNSNHNHNNQEERNNNQQNQNNEMKNNISQNDDIEEINSLDKTIIDVQSKRNKNHFINNHTNQNLIQNNSIKSINSRNSLHNQINNNQTNNQNNSVDQIQNDMLKAKVLFKFDNQNSNSSTQSCSYSHSNADLLFQQQQQVKNQNQKDKLAFYTNLAGLSPQQQYILQKSDEGQNEQIKQNKQDMINEEDQQNQIQEIQDSQDENIIQNITNESYNLSQLNQIQRTNKHMAEIKSFNNNNNKGYFNSNNNSNNNQYKTKLDSYKFSFGNTKNNNLIEEYPEKESNRIYTLNETMINDPQEMKTIIYNDEQIKQIKLFDSLNSNSKNNNSSGKKNQNKNNNDNIFSFAKGMNQNLNNNSNQKQDSLIYLHTKSPQRLSLNKQQQQSDSKDIINIKNNTNKNSLNKLMPTQLFIYDSPEKNNNKNNINNNDNNKFITIDDENQKNLLNQNSYKSPNSASSKLNDSKIRDKCSSCSKDRHSLPNSDIKQEQNTTPDKRKRFTADFKMNLLSSNNKNNGSTTKDKINSFNSINNNSQNNNIQSQKKSFSISNNTTNNISNNNLINEFPSTSSQNNNNSQSSSQKITFNKKARRSHPDQNLLNQQNVCLKQPKLLPKI